MGIFGSSTRKDGIVSVSPLFSDEQLNQDDDWKIITLQKMRYNATLREVFDNHIFSNFGRKAQSYIDFGNNEQNYPLGSPAHTLPTDNNDYPPWLFFRSEYQSFGEQASQESEQDREYYQARKRMADIIGFNYEGLVSSIEESDQIDSIFTAYFGFFCPMNTDSSVINRYVFFYLKHLRDNVETAASAASRYNSNVNWEFADLYFGRLASSVTFEERDGYLQFSYAAMHEIEIAGSVDNQAVEISKCIKTFSKVKRLVWDIVVGGWELRQVDVLQLVIKYQISETHYVQLSVLSPRTNFGVPPLANYAQVNTDVDSTMTVPLSNQILHEHFTHKEKNYLFKASARLIVAGIVKTNLKWYETEEFLFAFQVVTAFVTIASLGSMTGPMAAAYAKISAVVGNTILAVIVMAVRMYAIQIGIQKVYELIVKELGLEDSFVGSMLLLAYASYQMYKGNPDAERYMKIALGINEATQTVNQEDIQERYQQWAEIDEQNNNLLQAIQDDIDELSANRFLLDTVGWGSGANTQQLTPQEFYEVRGTTENVGIAVLDQVDKFYDVALRLPNKY